MGNGGFQIKKTSEHLGAEVLGLDLKSVAGTGDRNLIEKIQLALDKYIVLVFHTQKIDPREMENLGRSFGPLLNLRRKENGGKHIDDLEYLKIVSNGRTEDGEKLGDGSCRSQDWHTDGSAKDRPATYTYFYAKKVPRQPPKTFWMNCYLVYDALPQSDKDLIADLWVIHHEYSGGNEAPIPPSLPLEKRLTGPKHPLVRTHPRTERKSIYLPQRDDMLVDGLTESESWLLISRLRRFAAKSPFIWGTALKENDFVIWDNRPSMHRREGWAQDEVRILWHLTNEGELPVHTRESEQQA